MLILGIIAGFVVMGICVGLIVAIAEVIIDWTSGLPFGIAIWMAAACAIILPGLVLAVLAALAVGSIVAGVKL